MSESLTASSLALSIRPGHTEEVQPAAPSGK